MTATVYSLADARKRMRLREAAIAEAREARAAKIVKAIDAYMRKTIGTSYDPHTKAILFARESAWVLSELKSWTGAQWFLMGRLAGLDKFPSDDTKALVIEHFEWCAKNPVEVQVSR